MMANDSALRSLIATTDTMQGMAAAEALLDLTSRAVAEAPPMPMPMPAPVAAAVPLPAPPATRPAEKKKPTRSRRRGKRTGVKWAGAVTLHPNSVHQLPGTHCGLGADKVSETAKDEDMVAAEKVEDSQSADGSAMTESDEEGRQHGKPDSPTRALEAGALEALPAQPADGKPINIRWLQTKLGGSATGIIKGAPKKKRVRNRSRVSNMDMQQMVPQGALRPWSDAGWSATQPVAIRGGGAAYLPNSGIAYYAPYPPPPHVTPASMQQHAGYVVRAGA